MLGNRRSTFGVLTVAAAGILSWAMPTRTPASPSTSSPRGTPGMTIQPITSLLVEYFDQFIKDQNLERFRDQVARRYNGGTLERILANSSDKRAQRAAVLALGLIGSFENNAAVGKALHDSD